MSSVLETGNRLVVGFLGLCCALAILNVARGLLTRTEPEMLFALAQTIFALFAGVAAWNIHQWKKAGWYLGLLVVLQWLSSLLNLGVSVGWLAIALTFPIAGVGIWLWLPMVRARFEIRKAF